MITKVKHSSVEMENRHPKDLAYAAMCADLIHPGHLNIIRIAREHGSVIIGLLTDEAIASYKAPPVLPFAQRKLIVENLKGVSAVIPQESLDYTQNLRRLRPTVVVHGDDWRAGPQTLIRAQVINLLGEWGGTLIEPPYSSGMSSTGIRQRIAQAPPISTAIYQQLSNRHQPAAPPASDPALSS